MKNACLILMALVFAACNRPYINFNIDAPVIPNGVFSVYDDNGTMLYAANIKNGHLDLLHQYLERPGYFTFKVSNSEQRNYPLTGEIYLEPGNYNIKIKKVQGYPEITSTSSIQQELTDYYRSAFVTQTKRAKRLSYYQQLLNHSDNMTKEASNALSDTISRLHSDLNNSERDAFIAFTFKHPNSVASAHIMAGLDYNRDAVNYYKIFKSLSADAQNSNEGKDLAERLSALQALLPGHAAPDIIGQTPDGKNFDKLALNKKVYLLEFWKAGSTMTRVNHMDDKIPAMMAMITHQNDLGLIGVSLDHNREWWLDAIKVDNLTWPQYADLKGNDSHNLDNWQITTLPAYFLLDSDWHVIESNVDIHSVVPTINSYLAQH